MVLKMPEKAMGSEYVLIYMNMSNCARILNMRKSAEICLSLFNVVNMAQYA